MIGNNDSIKFVTKILFGVTAYCLYTHDLIVAKLLANREKYIEYIRSLILAGLVDESTVHERLDKVNIEPSETGDKIIPDAHAKTRQEFLKN
jgi:hypothetical protein